ncbi:MAG: 4-phosphoerythronate dehydrogenase [Gammaproteobacteria bacterium]|nr:4-phosphoerythronate dehydrogenase [Gammaproteobacteria bacterium]
MKIVADRGIPFVRQFFADLGNLVLADGRAIDARLLRDADILVTRTVTQIGEQLLRGSRVRFVATPTSGADHVDLDYLAKNGIGFAHARGCNARSVAEYVVSALCALAESGGPALPGRRAGVIGCGAVGSMVAHFLEALGIVCLRNDPPLREAGIPGDYRELPELHDVDILTLHVPLTDAGPHPTHGLLGPSLLSALKPDVVIINTSRGGVVAEPAFCRFLDRNRRASAVLDVWNGEPGIDPEMHARAKIGTPHIAGYSADARLRGTQTVSRAIRARLGRDPDEASVPTLPPPAVAAIPIAPGMGEMEAVQMAVLAGYDVRSDAAQLRRIGGLDEGERAAYFTALREGYPMRREFPAHTVSVPPHMTSCSDRLAALGFSVTIDG